MKVIMGERVPIKMWIGDMEIEATAMQQLKDLSALPFLFKHVAVMPDVHMGYGSTVGSVIATEGVVIPSAVGVDIGCGMAAIRTDSVVGDLDGGFAKLRAAIEKAVPHGRTEHGRKGDRGAWGATPAHVVKAWEAELAAYWETLITEHPKLNRNSHPSVHLGTLGTGNHFIEICVDEEERLWIMLHSGSRGPGNRIGTHFSREAQGLMEEFYVKLPHKELAFIPESHPLFGAYYGAVQWAQAYARANRNIMLNATLDALKASIPSVAVERVINCHHNYVDKEHHFGRNIYVTRKGAVRAREGDMGIIPGSMGDKSFIVRGKGNPESFCSCSHGAGRVMSRTKARATFSVADHERATEGVECRKDESVLDESPRAYKNIEEVMAAQEDLVSIEHTLKQVVCVKG